MLVIDPHLKGRRAVITGGSGVLCRAMAIELARHGVNIAILNRKEENGKKAAAEIVQSGGRAIAIACDVLDVESVKQAEQMISHTFGAYDMLINGAGGGDPQGNTTNETLQIEDINTEGITSFFDVTPEGFSHVLNLNLMGTWIPTQIFARQMINRRGATIINISSMAAQRPATKVPAYSASKAAVDNLTQWLAVHFADVGIRVNAIAGFFLTEQNKRMLTNEDGSLTDRSKKIIAHTPMRRFGQPEDLLGVLLWLVNENMSGFVTGVSIPIDGGFLAYSGV